MSAIHRITRAHITVPYFFVHSRKATEVDNSKIAYFVFDKLCTNKRNYINLWLTVGSDRIGISKQEKYLRFPFIGGTLRSTHQGKL